MVHPSLRLTKVASGKTEVSERTKAPEKFRSLHKGEMK